jgi:hypothetical protein
MKNCKKKGSAKNISIGEKYLEKRLNVELTRRKDELNINSTRIHKYKCADVEGHATYDVTGTLTVLQHGQIYHGGKSAPAQNEVKAEWVSGPIRTN